MAPSRTPARYIASPNVHRSAPHIARGQCCFEVRGDSVGGALPAGESDDFIKTSSFDTQLANDNLFLAFRADRGNQPAVCANWEYFRMWGSRLEGGTSIIV